MPGVAPGVDATLAALHQIAGATSVRAATLRTHLVFAAGITTRATMLRRGRWVDTTAVAIAESCPTNAGALGANVRRSAAIATATAISVVCEYVGTRACAQQVVVRATTDAVVTPLPEATGIATAAAVGRILGGIDADAITVAQATATAAGSGQAGIFRITSVATAPTVVRVGPDHDTNAAAQRLVEATRRRPAGVTGTGAARSTTQPSPAKACCGGRTAGDGRRAWTGASDIASSLGGAPTSNVGVRTHVRVRRRTGRKARQQRQGQQREGPCVGRTLVHRPGPASPRQE